MSPGKGTRRDLALARRAMRVARCHLAMARCGLRGADDASALRLLKSLLEMDADVTFLRRTRRDSVDVLRRIAAEARSEAA